MTDCPRDHALPTPKRTLLALISLVALVAALLASSATPVFAQNEVVVTPTDTNGCNGVRQTPGSENTSKEVVGGTLTPGGTAIFRLSFPFDEEVDEAESFEIRDCLFAGDDAVASWIIDAPNNSQENNGFVVFEVTLTLPDSDVTEYCNHARHQGTPPDAPGSNRKASVCFLLSGNLNVLKTDAGGDPLEGAVFQVDCAFPTTESAMAHTTIEAPTDGQVSDQEVGSSWASTSGGNLNVDVTTGDEGAILVNAPVGTTCSFTETAAPAGYTVADPASTTLTVSLADQSATFVNTRQAGTRPTATPTPAGGPGAATAAPTIVPNTASPGSAVAGMDALAIATVALLTSVGALWALSVVTSRRRGLID